MMNACIIRTMCGTQCATGGMQATTAERPRIIVDPPACELPLCYSIPHGSALSSTFSFLTDQQNSHHSSENMTTGCSPSPHQ